MVEVLAQKQEVDYNLQRNMSISRAYQLPHYVIPERGSCLLYAEGIMVLSVPWKLSIWKIDQGNQQNESQFHLSFISIYWSKIIFFKIKVNTTMNVAKIVLTSCSQKCLPSIKNGPSLRFYKTARRISVENFARPMTPNLKLNEVVPIQKHMRNESEEQVVPIQICRRFDDDYRFNEIKLNCYETNGKT